MQNFADGDSFFALIGRQAGAHAGSPAFSRLQSEKTLVGSANSVGVVYSHGTRTDPLSFVDEQAICLVYGAPRYKEDPDEGTTSRPATAREICSGYRRHGLDSLQELAGQFRIVLLDAHSGCALIATDRLGTLPVVSVQLENELVAFASDSSILMDLSGHRRKLDHTAIYDYLFFHQVPSPRSVYLGVQRLLPNQAVSLANGKFTTAHYWTPAFRAGENNPNPPQPGDFLPALQRAVDATSPNDRTACFLSGGLDSSSVVGTLARSNSKPTHAFTIGFSEPGYDETEYARIVAKHFDLQLHEYYLTPDDVADALPLISAAYDEPFGNSSAVPTYICAVKAREAGFDRLLAGDGGDELFAGNVRYAKQKLFEQYFRAPEFIRNILESDTAANSSIYRNTWPLRKLSRYVEQATQRLPDRMESANPLLYFQTSQVFDPDFVAGMDESEPYRLMRQWYDLAASDNFLNRMLWFDWKFTLTDNDLRKVSIMCRQAGIRVSYPMLDDLLIDLSIRLPPAQKLKGYKLRSWFKNGVRGFLPDEILSKKKHGFGLPFGEWLRKPGRMRDMAAGSLENAANLGIFREEFVNELRHRHESVHASHYGSLAWVVIMLEQWLSSRDLKP